MSGYALRANVLICGKIEVLTGLHIGGGRGKTEIGGVDQPVIRDPATGFPYLPGSSIRGKMRMLLEYSLCLVGVSPRDEREPGSVHECGKPDCPVCQIFGTAAEEGGLGPSRLIVRDAFPDAQTQEFWKELDTELLYTEYKGENYLDRLTSRANPRFFERVVPNSWFNFEMVYSVFNFPEVDDLGMLPYVFQGMRLLEHSALGGHGSRGYGKVRFHLYMENASLPLYKPEDYGRGKIRLPDLDKVDRKTLPTLDGVDVDELVADLRKKLPA
jgi:CRISPR-associated protein Csm3